MDFFDTIKMLFTSEAMASVITLLFAGIYVTIVMPDRKELQHYRDGMAQKVMELDVIPRLELQKLIHDTLKLENHVLSENIINEITDGIVNRLNENREYYAKLAVEKSVDIKAEIIQLNEVLQSFSGFIQESDIRCETITQELSDVVKLIETLYQVLNNLITEMEKNKLIDPIDRPALTTISTHFSSEQLDAFTTLMNKIMERQGATKLNKVLNRRGQ
jgi:hypothetical protein